jgi:hypothetical protein
LLLRIATPISGCGNAINRPRKSSSRCITQAASGNNQPSPGNAPNSASGVVAKLTTGIASALASGATHDVCWKR